MSIPTPECWLGGVVILLQEPVERKCFPYLPDGDSFCKQLSRIKGFKYIDRPMENTCHINGVWALVFEETGDGDMSWERIQQLKQMCITVWKNSKRD